MSSKKAGYRCTACKTIYDHHPPGHCPKCGSPFLESYEIQDGDKVEGFCFITTAVCQSTGKPDDCFELQTLRKFRDIWLRNKSNGEDMISEYYKLAPQIVSKIDSLPNKENEYELIYSQYIKPCIGFILNRKQDECLKLYKKMIFELKTKFNVSHSKQTFVPS